MGLRIWALINLIVGHDRIGVKIAESEILLGPFWFYMYLKKCRMC